MRKILPVLALACLVHPAMAAESVYTDLNAEKDCAIFATEEDGDWANMVCSGWRGYPVTIYAGDARESVFYGFSPSGEEGPAWESFAGFNSTGPTVEWRVETFKGVTAPYATIHRWFVSSPEDEEAKVEVLVVSKVGQMDARDGCAVGLVLATGNPGANDMARTIADEQARDFACGADERVIVGDPMPEFSRNDN